MTSTISPSFPTTSCGTETEICDSEMKSVTLFRADETGFMAPETRPPKRNTEIMTGPNLFSGNISPVKKRVSNKIQLSLEASMTVDQLKKTNEKIFFHGISLTQKINSAALRKKSGELIFSLSTKISRSVCSGSVIFSLLTSGLVIFLLLQHTSLVLLGRNCRTPKLPPYKLSCLNGDSN